MAETHVRYWLDASGEEAHKVVQAIYWRLHPLRSLITRDDRHVDKVRIVNADHVHWPGQIASRLNAIREIRVDRASLLAETLLGDNIRQTITVQTYKYHAGSIEIFSGLPHKDLDFETISVENIIDEYNSSRDEINKYDQAMYSFEKDIKEIMQQAVLPRITTLHMELAENGANIEVIKQKLGKIEQNLSHIQDIKNNVEDIKEIVLDLKN